MKNAAFMIGVFMITSFLMLLIFMPSYMIYNTGPEDCTVAQTKVVEVVEGSSHDIVFRNPYNDRFYINRGLEQGLNLDTLKSNVLNKTVTLHLAKLPLGTSSHISQLEVRNEVLFTEFK